MPHHVLARGAADVPRHFEADDEDALVEFPRALTQRVLPAVRVDGALMAGMAGVVVNKKARGRGEAGARAWSGVHPGG